MGWLWASSQTPKPEDNKIATPAQQSPPPPPSPPSEPVDPEIQKFLDLFQTDNAKASDPAAPSSQQESPSKPALPSWLSIRSAPKEPSTPAPLGDALSEALLPTEMSCRQAFDQAWACNGLGGQWNAVYRYGEMRSCSEHWDDFWFCMRTRGYSAEMREAMIKAHYRNKEYAKYGPGKPSSEDVWQGRREKAQPGTVFTEKID